MLIKRISLTVFFILALLSSYLLAGLTWQVYDIVSGSDTPPLPQTPSVINTATPAQDTGSLLRSIQKANLFGTEAAQTAAKQPPKPTPKTDTSNIKETRLNIQLHGLVHGEKGVAVISYSGKQGAYAVGDRIDRGQSRKIELTEIAAHYVIISNNGIAEKLTLPEKKKPKQKAVSQAVQVSTDRSMSLNLNTEQFHEILGGKPSVQIASNPLALSRFMILKPQRRGKTLHGYQIQPGRDKRLMQAAGLKPRDIITHINRTPAANLNISELYKLLQNGQNISLTLERNGQPLNMDISL